MENKLTIEIYGEQYPIKGDVDIEYMRELADMVDNKMRKLVKKNQYLPIQRIGVLTALHIADDYFQLKKDYDELIKLLEDK
ncbi:cell division protein ZapA [Pectinatus frisingensis]|jgi:cell division protein ZapA|uniref:cell division protein ZapA n=1 Tax=Pectinatus frisingensis TaxID=865 RepID=UPI0015F3B356|nr:cell division protein ZapA [Pectinatus frisingensis]